MLLPIKIPPGVDKRDSPNATGGRYTDADKVRFNGDFPEKWGGWTSFVDCTLEGAARGAVSWANEVGNQNLSVGTHVKLYVVLGGAECEDITPIRVSGTLSTDEGVTVSTTNSPKNLVTVNDTSHGLIEGAYVTFTSTTTVGGIRLNGEYIVNSVIDADNYTIIAASTDGPTTSTNGDGSLFAYAYQINPGFQSPGYGTGWGMAEWGGEIGWGDPASTGGEPVDMRHWSLDDYGNNLLASPFGGTLYDWVEGTDDTAQEITNAPDYIRYMFVTPERFVFALGVSTGSDVNPMRMKWPDQNDITDWVPTASNTANTRTLQNGSKLIAGCGLQDLISAVWSDTALYVFQYTGSDLVYEDRMVGAGCGLIGPMAFVNINGTAFWMSGHDFHMYAGGVGTIPNAGDMTDYVFRRMNRQQGQKTYCVYNPVPGTILWGYVSVDSTSLEPDEYVEVAMGNWAWANGTLPRTCGVIFRPHEGTVVMAKPVVSSSTDPGVKSMLFEHESGTDDDGSAMEAYISFGEYQIADGNQNTDIMGFVPDCQRQTGQLEVVLRTQEYPNSDSTFDSQTIILNEGEPIEDVRISGRVFGFTVRSNEVGGDFRLGIPALEIGGAGERR